MADPKPSDPAKPDAGSLADRLGMVVGSQFVGAAIGLAQSLLIVRLLRKDDYGTLAFLLMLHGTGRDLGMLAIPDSILYFAPKVSRPELRGLARQSMLILLGLGLVVGLILAGLALAPSVFVGGRTGLSTLLVLIAVATVLSFPLSIFGNLFIATNHHRDAAGISLVLTLLGAAVMLVPAALGLPIAWIIILLIASVIIRFILCEWLFRTLHKGVPIEPFPGGVRKQLGYVLPLAATRFAGIFNQRLDKFVVSLFFSASAYAEFSVGAQELPLVSILPYAVASTMLPQLVERYESGASRLEGARAAVELWHAGMRKVMLVMLPLSAFLLLMAEPLMHVLYGASFLPAAAPFRVYTALMPLRVTAYGIMLMAFGRTALTLRVQLAGMVVNVGLSMLLLWKIGMLGAPLAAVLTQAFMIVLLLFHINAIARVGLRGIFPWAHYGRVAAASIIAGVPLAAALVLLSLSTWSLPRPHPALALATGAPIYLGIYLVVANALGTMGPEDRAFVARWLRLEPLRRKRAPEGSGTR